MTKLGKTVWLRRIELRLPRLLMENAGIVVPTHVLMRNVWNIDHVSTTDLLGVTLRRLRGKLEDKPLTRHCRAPSLAWAYCSNRRWHASDPA